jgi:hypothetical protein
MNIYIIKVQRTSKRSPFCLSMSGKLVVHLLIQRYGTVSAYNFCDPRRSHITNSTEFFEGQKEFYDCFPTADAYGKEILSNSTCGALARKGIGHISKNTCFYLCGVVDLLMKFKHKVRIIRTETCEVDFKHFLRETGSNVAESLYTFSRSRMNKTMESLIQSEISRYNLIQHLEESGEYGLYRFLLRNFETY